MKKIVKIDGMKCDKCTSRIKNALENLDNIKEVTVNLEKKEASLEYDESINLDLVKETINDLGFEVLNIN